MNMKEMLARTLIFNVTLMGGYRHPPAAARPRWECTKLKPKMVLRMEGKTGMLLVSSDVWKRLLDEGIIGHLDTENPGDLKLLKNNVWVHIDHETKDEGVCLLLEADPDAISS